MMGRTNRNSELRHPIALNQAEYINSQLIIEAIYGSFSKPRRNPDREALSKRTR
jgi:hypothetical protein